ncbi:MAG: hypothetical protein JZU70_03690 [Chlorobium sp.]|nr:hypothetical protein [Chlorobium sp.]
MGFDDIIPNHPMDISSWAIDFALAKHVDVIDNRAQQIRCYHPGYTFVEKLQAIVTKYCRHQDSSYEFVTSSVMAPNLRAVPHLHSG